MLIRSSGDYHWRNYFLTSPTITLNGIEQRDCIEANDVAGYIIRYRRGTNGERLSTHDHYLTERIRGTVIISGQSKPAPEDSRAQALGRAQTKRDRREIKRAEIVRRQQIAGE